jgi:hypothetical protein
MVTSQQPSLYDGFIELFPAHYRSIAAARSLLVKGDL